MSGQPWYKRYGADFVHGTLGLTLEEKGAYSLCLDLIYDRGGPIPDDPRWLAGVCGVSVRKWNSLRESLIASGKLVVRGAALSNERAEIEIENAAKTSRKLAENGAKGGSKRAENAVDDRDFRHLAEAGLKHRARDQKPEAREEGEETLPSVGQRPTAPGRGTRLPDDWQPSEVDRAYARQLGASDVEIDRQAEKLRNHFHAKSGKDATKASWPATWRNWCLTAQERGEFRGGAPPANGQPRLALAPMPGSRDASRQDRNYSADRPQRAGPHDAFAAAMADVAAGRDDR